MATRASSGCRKSRATWVPWTFLLDRFLGTYDLNCVSRKTSASPATGYKTQHLKEQADLLDRAFNETTD